MGKFIDLSKQKFPNIDVISKSKFSTSRRIKWECRCVCGNIFHAAGDGLRSGKTKSCGCQHIGKNAHNYSGYGEITGSYWNTIQNSAKRRKINFDLKIEDVWNLFIQQNKCCALSGIPLIFNSCKKDKLIRTASLDRKDSNGDYILENVQWVHKDINIIKMYYTDKYFINTCHQVSNFNNLKQSLQNECPVCFIKLSYQENNQYCLSCGYSKCE